MQDIDNDIKTDQNLSLNEESKNNDKEDHNLYNYPTHYDLLNYINDIYKPNTEPNKICIKEQDIILKALSNKEKSKSNPSIISYNKKMLKSIKKSHQKESKNKINIKSEKDIKHKANSISKKEKKNNDSFNWNNIENEWKKFIQTDNEKKFEDINTKINQMANLMNIYADKVSNIDDNINTIMKILLNLNKKKLVSKSKSKSKNNELIGIKKEKDKNYLGKKIKKSEEFKIKEENKEKTNYDKHDKYEPSLKKPDINKSITKASNTSQMKLKEPILYEQNLKIKNNELHKTTNNINKGGFTKGMIKGILCCFGSTLINCAVDICNKVLAKNKIPITTQLFYLGFFTLSYSLIYIIIIHRFKYCIPYILFSFLQGTLFYIANTTKIQLFFIFIISTKFCIII